MRSAMAMTDIQKKLGFKYTTSIWLRNVNELPHVIRRLRESINRLVAEYSHLSQPEAKDSLRLRQRTNDVLDDLGRILWPDGSRTHDRCPQWLMVAPCDMYRSNLFWNNEKHQARIRDLLFKLLITRIRNHQTAGTRRDRQQAAYTEIGTPASPTDTDSGSNIRITPTITTQFETVQGSFNSTRPSRQASLDQNLTDTRRTSQDQWREISVNANQIAQQKQFVAPAPMYPLATSFPEISTIVVKHESTPAVGSSADQAFVIDDAEAPSPRSKRRRLTSQQSISTVVHDDGVKSEQGDDEHSARPNLSIVTTAMPIAAQSEQQQPTPQTSINSTSPTPSASSRSCHRTSIRLNWSCQVAPDIIKISSDMTLEGFRHRIQQYQRTHHHLRDKPIAAMIVRPADFRIVWDDDLGQSGWEELQGLMSKSKEVSMEVEWDEQAGVGEMVRAVKD